MTYEEFAAQVREKFSLLVAVTPANYWAIKFEYANKDTPINDLLVYWEFEVGGMSGGSCWGGEATGYTVTNIEEYSQLDEILEKYAPEISFLKYKKLTDLVKHTNKSVSEYYGNSTDYVIKYIPLKEVWKFIYV